MTAHTLIAIFLLGGPCMIAFATVLTIGWNR